MGTWEAGLWGLAGGAAAGLLSLMTSVVGNNFRWWVREERGPRLFVFGCSLLLGAVVAGAAGSEMSGAWPAFVIGAGAPSTIRGLLGGVQVGQKSEAERIPAASLDAGSVTGFSRAKEMEAEENVL